MAINVLCDVSHLMACCLARCMHFTNRLTPAVLHWQRVCTKLALPMWGTCGSPAPLWCPESHSHELFLQGVTCWLSIRGIQQAVHQSLGATCASAFMLLCTIQFHLPFYMSRTLPNTFATAVLGFALADWVTGGHPRRLVCLLALSTVSLETPSQLLLASVSSCTYPAVCNRCTYPAVL